MNLASLGWNDTLHHHFRQIAPLEPALRPARVARQDRNAYRVLTEDGEHPARLHGRLRAQARAGADAPVVGDWVAARPDPLGGDGLVLEALLPRGTRLSRAAAGKATAEQVVAANVDVLLVLMGLDADFNPARLSRYLALAWGGGARPVVVLNKADACPDPEARRRAAGAVAAGAPVLVASALRHEGLDEVRAHLGPGRTVALVGSSGVGKSTLANALLGEDLLATGATRAHDGRGRHTTTFRQLLPLPHDQGVLLDTPGMRELSLWDEGGEGLRAAFRDVEELAAACRFRDCAHEREPGCAVRAALAEGALPGERWEQWRKLRREAAFHERRRGENAERDGRRLAREWGKVGRAAQAYKRERLGR